MASPLFTAAFTAAATGALVAGITVAVMKPTQRVAPSAVSAEGAPSVELVAELRAGLDALRRENMDLRDRVVALEEAPERFVPPRQPLAAEPTPIALDAAEELEQLVAALRDPQQAPPPNFEATVAAALENIRTREDAEREQRREELRLQRLDERLERLRTDLGLNQTQVNDLRDMAINLDIKREEAMSKARDLGDWEGVRDSMRTMRDEAEAGLQRILSPSQAEQLEESGGLMRALGGFGPGGPGGGPGGDRGRGEDGGRLRGSGGGF